MRAPYTCLYSFKLTSRPSSLSMRESIAASYFKTLSRYSGEYACSNDFSALGPASTVWEREHVLRDDVGDADEFLLRALDFLLLHSFRLLRAGQFTRGV